VRGIGAPSYRGFLITAEARSLRPPGPGQTWRRL
jgi:hypothetical protein